MEDVWRSDMQFGIIHQDGCVDTSIWIEYNKMDTLKLGVCIGGVLIICPSFFMGINSLGSSCMNTSCLDVLFV